MLTLQVIRIMDKLWLQDGLDLKMLTFSCLVTGPKRGLIELITEAETLRKIQVREKNPNINSACWISSFLHIRLIDTVSLSLDERMDTSRYSAQDHWEGAGQAIPSARISEENEVNPSRAMSRNSAQTDRGVAAAAVSSAQPSKAKEANSSQALSSRKSAQVQRRAAFPTAGILKENEASSSHVTSRNSVDRRLVTAAGPSARVPDEYGANPSYTTSQKQAQLDRVVAANTASAARPAEAKQARSSRTTSRKSAQVHRENASAQGPPALAPNNQEDDGVIDLFMIKNVYGLLNQTLCCNGKKCKVIRCGHVQALAKHVRRCQNPPEGGCDACDVYYNLHTYHAAYCRCTLCPVPLCTRWKQLYQVDDVHRRFVDKLRQYKRLVVPLRRGRGV